MYKDIKEHNSGKNWKRKYFKIMNKIFNNKLKITAIAIRDIAKA